MPVVELEIGSIHYEEAGPPDGPAVLCLHGYLMGGSLYRGLAERLAAREVRTIAPTWPFGAHATPMRRGADLTPHGIARAVVDLADALGLADVTLLGNDTGGAIAQVVAAEHGDRLGRLVLTNCDAFENFPPSFFKALLPAARVPGALRAALFPLRTAAARRSPLGYGLLSHGDVDHLAREWVRPAMRDPEVFEDGRRFTLGLRSSVTLDAAAKLPAFRRPALLVWGTEDKLFPVEHARRLAAILPDARLELVEGSRTFVMVDQPDRLASAVADFVERTSQRRSFQLSPRA